VAPVPQAARDTAESLRNAPNSVVSGGPRRRRETLKVLAPSAVPLLPEGPLKRSIWLFIIAPWYKSGRYLISYRGLNGRRALAPAYRVHVASHAAPKPTMDLGRGE